MWNYILCIFYSASHFTSLLIYFINVIKVLICNRLFSIRTTGGLNNSITITIISQSCLSSIYYTSLCGPSIKDIPSSKMMLELQSTDSENKCFEDSIGNHGQPCLSTEKKICSHNSKNPLSKSSILSSREAGIMMMTTLALMQQNTSPYGTGNSKKK